MIKKLSCRSLGMDCDFVAYGNTVDEVLDKGMEHAKADHPEKYREMMKMTTDEMKKMRMEMMAKVEDVESEGM